MWAPAVHAGSWAPVGIGERELDDPLGHLTTSRDPQVDLALRGVHDPALTGADAVRAEAAVRAVRACRAEAPDRSA